MSAGDSGVVNDNISITVTAHGCDGLSDMYDHPVAGTPTNRQIWMLRNRTQWVLLRARRGYHLNVHATPNTRSGASVDSLDYLGMRYLA